MRCKNRPADRRQFRRSRFSGRLSGGERQCLRLARVILCRPFPAVLDEAIGALDAAVTVPPRVRSRWPDRLGIVFPCA